MAIESLRPAMATSRISRAMDVPRSSIYYRRTEGSGRRKPRIQENMGTHEEFRHPCEHKDCPKDHEKKQPCIALCKA